MQPSGNNDDGNTVLDGITDTVVEGIEDSEVAEVVVVIFACLYLGASQLGYIPTSHELTIAAIMVIGATVGLDSLYKKIKRQS